MSRIAYVNGRYVPHNEAAVHIEDRGYQFADGVYEVTAVRGGKFVDSDWHLDRLARSLGELQIDMPMSRGALSAVMVEVARRNRVTNGIVYLQITLATLARLARGGKWLDPDTTTKVSRKWVYRMMFLSLPAVCSNALLRFWIKRLRRQVERSI